MKNEETIKKSHGSGLTDTQQAMKRCREMLRREIMLLNGGCSSKAVDSTMDYIDHYACLCITNAQEMRSDVPKSMPGIDDKYEEHDKKCFKCKNYASIICFSCKLSVSENMSIADECGL